MCWSGSECDQLIDCLVETDWLFSWISCPHTQRRLWPCFPSPLRLTPRAPSSAGGEISAALYSVCKFLVFLNAQKHFFGHKIMASGQQSSPNGSQQALLVAGLSLFQCKLPLRRYNLLLSILLIVASRDTSQRRTCATCTSFIVNL